VNKALCAGAGVQSGDVVDVVMERDDQERTVDAPAALKKALVKNKTAKANWEKMAFTHKKEIALWIADAKKEETRERRVEKAIQVLQKRAKWTG